MARVTETTKKCGKWSKAKADSVWTPLPIQLLLSPRNRDIPGANSTNSHSNDVSKVMPDVLLYENCTHDTLPVDVSHLAKKIVHSSWGLLWSPLIVEAQGPLQ